MSGGIWLTLLLSLCQTSIGPAERDLRAHGADRGGVGGEPRVQDPARPGLHGCHAAEKHAVVQVGWTKGPTPTRVVWGAGRGMFLCIGLQHRVLLQRLGKEPRMCRASRGLFVWLHLPRGNSVLHGTRPARAGAQGIYITGCSKRHSQMCTASDPRTVHLTRALNATPPSLGGSRRTSTIAQCRMHLHGLTASTGHACLAPLATHTS